MSSKRLFLVFVLLCAFLLNHLFAHQNRPHHTLEKINLKTNILLQTASGKMDATNGVIKYLYNLRIDGYVGNSEQIARAYLNDYAQRFGIDVTKESLRTFTIKSTRGGTSVMFDQMINGIPVYDSRIIVTLNKRNQITFATSMYRPVSRSLSTAALLSSSQAKQFGRDYLQITGKMIGPEKSDLMYFESADRGFVLSWRVVLPTENPMGDWELFVDANSGEIIHVRDMMMYHDGQGLVWDPDPLTTAGVEYGGAYIDNSDANSTALNDERTSVILRDITFEGGVYKLEGPYCVLADRESPTDAFPELADSSAFNFTRNEQGFEDVMIYYHIDLSTRRLILDLGYDEPLQHNFQVDPHGLSGDDNSHYVPSDNYCAFGEGGVDDAEDADVIWHEHAHSFQTNLTGGMAYTGETMSLQEGSSDYWAASYSRYINDYNWGFVFTWDGHNEFWDGRRCDLDWIYPDDYVTGHNGGQIWSSALMEIWEQIGRDATDTDFIETHYIWGSSPGLQDAAQAFIQADENVYGGAHKGVIIDVFDAHGLVDKADYMASISHAPLGDSEQSGAGYDVIAMITAGADALDPSRIWVIYGNAALTDSLLMNPTATADEYSATIPDLGNEIDIYYYISVIDQGNNVSNDPSNAPTGYHAFHVGADSEAPLISHTPLSDQALQQWPATVKTTVTDNGTVDTVVCYFGLNSKTNLDSFALLPTGNDVYENTFPLTAAEIALGDSFYYYIYSKDGSTNANSSQNPQAGFHGFQIIDSKGLILIVDDDPNGKLSNQKPEKETMVRKTDSFGKSADDMKIWLDALGYSTDQVDVTTALSIDFSQYNLIISSSGANTSPAGNSSYRTKLENWVADSANKLLIEGGEIGYEATTNSSYGTFDSNVLHVTNWSADNSGNLQIVGGQETHPIVTTPNALGSPITINYSGFGDQDAMTPEADAYLIYEPANRTDRTAVLVYDPDADPISAQTVFFSFNLAIVNATDAQDLLENSVEYLFAKNADIGAISGTVDLSDTEDDSAVSVYLSGALVDTLLTDTNGFYMFSGLANGSYTITVHKDGYTTTDSLHSGIAVNQDTAANIDFTLDPIVSSINELAGIPGTFGLSQNFPNPFNPNTAISYQLPAISQVELIIYNALGQRVRTLVNSRQEAGRYSISFNATGLGSGLYYYKITAGKFEQIRKMLLVK